VRERIIRMGGD